jgi:SulP family sulfate permease
MVACDMYAIDAIKIHSQGPFVLGALLIYLGADQLHKWIVDSRKPLSTPEYLSLLAIIIIIVQWASSPAYLSASLSAARDGGAAGLR